MNAVILSQRTVKLTSVDPNLLTDFAQKVRNLGGIFRTSLLPKKRVATLTFYQLPSVELPEILNELVNAETNSTPTNISEQSLPSNNSSASSVVLATTQSTAIPASSSETITATPSTAIPAPSSEAISTTESTTTQTPSNEPIATTQSTATQDPSNEAIPPEPETLEPMDAAKPSTANPEENTLASLDELLAQRKTKLKKLAQHHKIPGRSSMTHEEKAEALVGFVRVSDL